MNIPESLQNPVHSNNASRFVIVPLPNGPSGETGSPIGGVFENYKQAELYQTNELNDANGKSSTIMTEDESERIVKRFEEVKLAAAELGRKKYLSARVPVSPFMRSTSRISGLAHH